MGTVCVITGGSAGVGRATVRLLAEQGYSIAVLARGRSGLLGAVRDADARGAEAIGYSVDVADADAVFSAAKRIESELGPIGVWINNAMTSVFSPVHELQPAEVKRVAEVNYLGSVHGTLAALQYMRPRNAGCIIQVGSALAYRSIPLQASYCASKHAIKGFVESLRTELIHDKSRITLSVVNLPALNTPQFSWVKSRLENKAQPVPPLYQPEVAAQAILWAIEHKPRVVNVGWPTLKAVWAEKLIPGLADRYLARNGYQAQQTPEPESADRPSNLWSPVDEDRGARGTFDGIAREISLQLWVRTHWVPLAAAAAAVGGGLRWARS